MQRRTFIKNTVVAASAAVVGVEASVQALTSPVAQPLIKKSLKYGMVTENLSVMDKFKLLKDLGFDGVELDSPNDINPKEILEARDKTGLELPGVVNSAHWKSPLSSADPKVREVCSKAMEKSLYDCKMYGGTTVLLVPGVVNEGTSYKEAYERSQIEIKKLIPIAEKTGIKIALENVWNNFLISPLEAARYVDEINHPLVGWYFDVGNILRYGWPEHWIEALGKRIMKIDIKEFSRKKQNDEGLWKGFNVELMEGDCNWPVVNKALAKIGYSGWASAEVPGGDRKRLEVISQKMDGIFKAV
ncbi:sugar phosphate isomerase/epimerase family protein [Runella sp.]|uniref:sugar phosphate isomerase/epimerase family protein n=1 Tax=Runella sp. TaxID=1960881 RepID=UPI003D1249CD